MSALENIKEPIDVELRLFDTKFKEAFLSDNAFLTKISKYILQENGKKLRPTIVLLAAKLCGKCNEASIDVAVSLELLHTSSLVHDDIVDDTMERRGRASINSLWNNKIAVLVGDFLFTKSALYATQTRNIEIVQMLGNIGYQLSDGELLQLSKANQFDTTEEDYYTVIRKKTALLFACCAKMGAMSVGADAEMTANLGDFGEYLGLCFQIKDDIFDYSDNTKIGKPTGNDIREGKITLPLIFSLKNDNSARKEKIVNWLKINDLSNNNIAEIIRFVQETGGIDYATKQMTAAKTKAIKSLAKFPESAVKQSLIACAEFAAERNY
jgi:octaprenyl-diphosphate synthase